MNLAVFTNILNPYRIAFFDRLYSHAKGLKFNFIVYVMVGEKSDRPWKYDEYKRDYTRLLDSKTLHIRNVAYLHFNSGIELELKTFHPDVVVMAGSYLQPTNIYLLLRKKKYGYITTFWSESHFSEMRNYGFIKLRIREILRRQTIGRMDAFWFPGKKAEEFIDHYRREGSVKIQVPNTIDNTFFGTKYVNNIDIPSPRCKLLFTPARLSREKGILEFCDILNGIPKESYRWIIAGDGPLRQQIQTTVETKDLNVELVGLKNQDEIREYYSVCDIFVLPSVSDPNPLTTIEALWMKKPLFLSENVGNFPEALEDGKNGYVFSYSDIPDAIQKLKVLLSNDGDWYNNASAHSYAMATELFDVDMVAREALIATSKLIGDDN